MKIAKLLTWHWGSLEDREWHFADTVLLTGESGSGKSTLLDAIQTVLTAAHQHLVQFNIGQDESTQSRRGGKEPRTLAAYALGQQADGVFLRSRSTSYAGIVFEASEHVGEQAPPFTALIGVEAFEDGRRAVLQGAPQFFIVRRPLSLDHLARRAGEALAMSPLPLKELYVLLQHRLQAGSDTVVQRFPDKGGYLQHLYGALMGKTAVGESEAVRAAKSIVKAMAYKELGNVNDLVRDEILEPHDFSRDLDKMRELMRSIAALKAEAERLALNLERLDAAAECAREVLDESRRFVITTIAHALRARSDQRATADDIRRLLLANDQGASERALKELADYRNYRRYDIVRTSPVGQTRLSTWGTGSGGELETPFYVVRSAVLAHALGHFGRERREAPALRLMLSDEAFSKMDESRSRSVLQFLSGTLGLQLVVAMPTSKSGAVKPEFDKEFTFSKVLARRDGKELFISEAQEKTLHREALARLWQAHATQAREAARAAHEGVRMAAAANNARHDG